MIELFVSTLPLIVTCASAYVFYCAVTGDLTYDRTMKLAVPIAGLFSSSNYSRMGHVQEIKEVNGALYANLGSGTFTSVSQNDLEENELWDRRPRSSETVISPTAGSLTPSKRSAGFSEEKRGKKKLGH